MTYGKLKELNVQEGDAVRFHKSASGFGGRYDSYKGKIAVIAMQGNVKKFSDGTGGFSANNDHIWELFSRAGGVSDTCWQSVPDTDKEYRVANGGVEFRDKQQWKVEYRYDQTYVRLGNTSTYVAVYGPDVEEEELAQKICKFLQAERDA